MTKKKDFDAIIVGGSYAGLSAAMALGRSLRNVLVIDSGKPCNAPTPHSQNFLTHDGKTPAEIARIAKSQVAAYDTIQFHDGLAVKGTKTANGFTISLESGETVNARKLIFATGIKDKLLNIPGFVECWGTSVIHCPYCHGYEYRAKKTAALANGETAMHYAMLVGNLTNDLTIFTNGEPEFTPEQLAKLKQHHIPVIDTEVVAIEHEHRHLRNVVLKDGTRMAFDALYYRPPFEQHSNIPGELGCELTEQGHIKVDPFQKTTVEGIYACGDNASMMRSVANAVAAGNMTGAMVNRELAAERF